jgi:hypothetical protein
MRPNFFLVGTTKGGTSTLTAWLRQHPDIALPKRKELHFYCECPPGLRAAQTDAEYLKMMGSGKVVGEASPCYLYYPVTSNRLREEFPDSKILVSLRDPVERFWSHYLMNEVYRTSGQSAERALDQNLSRGRSNAVEDLVGMGYYGEQIERYRSLFPGERVEIVYLEDIASHPEQVARKVLDFLEVPHTPIDTDVRDKVYVEPRGRLGQLFLRTPSLRRAGARVLPHQLRRGLRTRLLGSADAKPEMSLTLQERLQHLYREDSRRLETLVGGLPWSWHR